MPSVPDYYALLGVSPDAGGDAVRRAYREAALRLHPDRNGGSQATGERRTDAGAQRGLAGAAGCGPPSPLRPPLSVGLWSAS